MILSIIDPQEFLKPLGFPNPLIVGNVGERTLQFNVWVFNETALPFSFAGQVRVQFGGIGHQKEINFTLAPGERTQFLPRLVVPLDAAGLLLPDGEYDLRVECGDAAAEIVVRVNQTELHLVSAWPEPVTPNTNEIVRAELQAAEDEVEWLVGSIAAAQDKLKSLQVRIPKLKALIE